jgi:hypothetical protein
MQCRICFEEGGDLLTPCRCRGTSAYIHRDCLLEYIRHYPDRICRVCQCPLMPIADPRDFVTMLFVVFLMGVLLLLSNIRLIAKISLLAVSWLSMAYYLKQGIFPSVNRMVLTCLAILFLPGGSMEATYMFLGVLGILGTLYTLCRYVPAILLLGILVVAMVAMYLGFLTFMLYHMLDSYGFTVYMAAVYLLWSAALQERPLRYQLA